MIHCLIITISYNGCLSCSKLFAVSDNSELLVLNSSYNNYIFVTFNCVFLKIKCITTVTEHSCFATW